MSKRITPSTIIATAATVLALGGTATAASLITGADIKNGTVTSADIKNASLVGADVKNSSLTGTDVKNGSIGPADLSAAAKAGAVGPAGPAGPQGVAGPAGPAGTTAVRVVTPASSNISAADTVVASLALPAGSHVLSAKVRALSGGATDRTAFCRLETAGNDQIDFAAATLPAVALAQANLPMQGVLAGPATVQVECSLSNAEAWTATSISLLATEVQSVNP